jgi:cysteinyl-tRNA synthetase
MAPAAEEARDAMLAALDDDFDTPAALAALYAYIAEQNRADRPAPGSRQLIEDFDAIFNVLPQRDQTPAGESDEWIEREVERRQQLRSERRFADADEVRDRLLSMGVVVEDTPDGVRWHRAAEPAR